MLIPSNEVKTYRRPLLPERPRDDFDPGEKGDDAFSFYQRMHEKTKGVVLLVPRIKLDAWDELRTEIEALDDGDEEGSRNDRPKRVLAFLRVRGSELVHEIEGLMNERGEALRWGTDRDLILGGLFLLGLIPDFLTSIKRSQEPGLLDTFRLEDLGVVGTGSGDSDTSVG